MTNWKNVETIPQSEADLVLLTKAQRVMILKSTKLTEWDINKFNLTHWMYLSDLVHLPKE